MIVILVLLFEIVIGTLLNHLFILNDFFSYICIALTSVVMCACIAHRFKGFQLMVLAGFLLRIFLFFADIYSWFPIPGSGSDAKTFYELSVDNLHRGYHIYLTNYTVYLTALFSWIGPQRLFAQFLNVVYGIGAIYYVYKSLNLLQIDIHLKKTLMIIVCFMPNLIIFSGILLREAIIILGTSASVYYFLLWMKQGKLLDYIKSIGFVLLGAYMHSGMLGLLLGYLLAFVFYDRKEGKIQIRLISVFYMLFVFSFLIFVVIKSGYFTSYLDSVLQENAESGFLTKVNYKQDAGSAYLTWLTVGSWEQALLFLPIKIFYFLFSPLPLNWRGIPDIIVFLGDSCIYFWLLWRIYHTRLKVCSVYKNSLIFLMIGFWVAVSMYSYGTMAAGTAMRHRAKFCALLIVAAGIQATKLRDDAYEIEYGKDD